MTALSKMPEVGPLGRHLVANVDRIRQERRLSWRELSRALDRAGRPIPPLGLSRMMQAGRRIDVDEASALAEVLGVTLAELLAASDAAPAVPPHPAFREAGNLAARIADLAAASGDPAAAASLTGYVDRALRRVQIEVEELLEAVRRAA